MATQTEKKSCFFITPIGAETSADRNRSDWVLNLLVKPALAGKYEVIRADHISKPGSITDQIIQQIAHSDLAIADLTGLNPNVVYELAIRHTLNLPTVQIMDSDQKLPFDLFGERTIFFKHDNHKSIEKAKFDLRAFVKETERSAFKSTSPVSRSIELLDLRERSTAISDALSSILTEVLAVKRTMDHVESDTSLIESSFMDVESSLDDVKETLQLFVPYTGTDSTSSARRGLYVDNNRLIRLFEEIELLLQKVNRKFDR